MIIMSKEASWPSVKKELSKPDFLNQLKNVDKDHISQKTLLKIEKLTHDPKMAVEKIDKLS